MLVTKLLFFLNLIIVSLFAFTIKTGFLENFLSKIGNLRVKRLAKSLERKKRQN